MLCLDGLLVWPQGCFDPPGGCWELLCCGTPEVLPAFTAGGERLGAGCCGAASAAGVCTPARPGDRFPEVQKAVRAFT